MRERGEEVLDAVVRGRRSRGRRKKERTRSKWWDILDQTVLTGDEIVVLERKW